ncbi:hypothetical protein DL93DRAFT_1026444 [Clavulina sp. PMI_390]|nr:hypothetical protein DL93DRAFT_1026444 [Clavulina sp. PMI_390]
MLDGHAYLTKRGWKGKGNALRSGGIAKPLTVTQKRTLSGLGKDRDEAFPFWEHVYATSLSTIKLKVDNDSDTSSDDESSDASPDALKRTSTGIISNRRPTTGVSAHPSSDSAPRLSILANAKRDLAKRQLYSRFYRGPVVTNIELEPEIAPTPVSSSIPSESTTTTSTPLPASPLLQPIASSSSTSIPDLSSSIPSSLPPKKAKKRKRDSEQQQEGSHLVVDPSRDDDDRAARKAERQARREDRARRRVAREVRRAARAAKNPVAAVAQPLEEVILDTPESMLPQPLAPVLSDPLGNEKPSKKKKKRQKEAESVEGVLSSVSVPALSLGKEGRTKKKRRDDS